MLEFLRLRYPHLPAIILTGAHLTEEEEERIRRGAAHVFYKPHGYQAIIEVLNARLAALRNADVP